MKRKLLIGLAVVLGLVALVGVIGLTARSIPATSKYAIDIEAWRSLAASLPGPRPSEVRVLEIATNRVGQWIAIEGGSFGETFDMRGYAFQVRWADGRSLIIDPINDAASQEEFFPHATLDAAAWLEMQAAMLEAEAIIATHEHFDHVNGLTKSPHFDALVSKAIFSRAQVDADLRLGLSGIDDRTRAGAQVVDYRGAHALRPGIVLIEAPSHTPGSQLIYLRLADDRELLMVGDVAYNAANIRRPATRPRIVEWAMGEQGENTAHWLRALNDLARAHPEVKQIVAHDRDTVEPLVQAGNLGQGFVVDGG